MGLIKTPSNEVIVTDTGSVLSNTGSTTPPLPNSAPLAANDVYQVDADNTLTMNLLVNDDDPDGDNIVVDTFNGGPAGVQQTINGALVTVQSDGVVNLDPNGSFDHLTGSQTSLVTFDYVIKDTDDATDSATVTVTINAAGVSTISPGSDIAIWDQVLSYHDGTGIGVNSSAEPLQDASAWSAATPGVSSSTTPQGANQENAGASVTSIDGVYFQNDHLYSTGDNVVGQNIRAHPHAQGSQTGTAILQFQGQDPIFQDSEFINTGQIQKPAIVFNHGQDTIGSNGTNIMRRVYGEWWATDYIKAPMNAVFIFEDSALMGGDFGNLTHLDLVDLRKCAAGSRVTRVLMAMNHRGQASAAGQGFVNAIRQQDGYISTDITVEYCIMAGSNEIGGPAGTLMGIGNGATTGLRYKKCIMDLRQFGTYIYTNLRGVEHWDVYTGDYDQAISQGTWQGVTLTPVPYPNLGAEPATIPADGAAPSVSGGSGKVSVVIDQPDNHRSHITSFDVRFRENSGAWQTTSTNLDQFEITGVSGSIDVQYKAINGVGTATNWSGTGTGTAS